MSHYLLCYQRREGRILHMMEFADQRTALAARFEEEPWHAGDPNMEVIVLGADSLEAIQNTHGRYFMRKADYPWPPHPPSGTFR